MKRFVAFIVVFILLVSTTSAKTIEELSAKSYILLDGNTGEVLLENNADEQLPPASITKIMTLLLAMEALDSGQIHTDDIVTVSETAAIHQGSHVFLAAGEQITVNDLLKAIAVASGNDASIAIAELLCGTQEKFVVAMNEKAENLGMKNTHFVNCNGLDTDNHYSSARDVGIMTCELLKHPQIFNYTTIWMDTLRDGEFQLANTNKLIRFYEGANGMKTGSTSKAGYCLSATAVRNDVQLAAVVMGAPSSKERFADASTLLNFGFQNYSRKVACEKGKEFGAIAVNKGVGENVTAIADSELVLLLENNKTDQMKEQIILPESLDAPIALNQKIGEVVYSIDEKEVGRVDLIAENANDKLSFGYLLKQLTSQCVLAI